ncbi:YlbD family protein [Alkalicoccobacillus plakortidis]|uniref:YlbD family protein n=1 Tax=Alkalicoccobacillus plakortidis TaxID=444060 RepID=A0ABT0XHN8_9BACI|nr:YlbD family protein [Alkalicoccobacillus plakortidis]MCM2674848.1 YlbD family protein [Alkalicoccobacillus plakortidis]
MVSSHELHPSVQEFKAFVREHPKLTNEIRLGNKSLQAYYEEWTVLGADHSQWDQFKADASEQYVHQEEPQSSSSSSSENNEQTEPGQAAEFMGQIMGMVKKMNVQDLQNHLAQFSSVLGNVQTLIQSFQRSEGQETRSNSDQPFFVST